MMATPSRVLPSLNAFSRSSILFPGVSRTSRGSYLSTDISRTTYRASVLHRSFTSSNTVFNATPIDRPVNNVTPSRISTLTTFPAPTFLENIAIRRDSSMLLTCLDNNSIYLSRQTSPHKPILLHTFSHSAMGIVEVSPDVFYISSSQAFAAESGTCSVWRLDMNMYSPLNVLPLTKAFDVPAGLWLNGSALLSAERQVLLLADCLAGMIWRVDLLQTPVPKVSVWLQHSALATGQCPELGRLPGVNGIKYNATDGHVYWTNTVTSEFWRIAVDDGTFDPIGEPQIVADNIMTGDDFVIDENNSVAYVTTHAKNTVETISLGEKAVNTLAGSPDDMLLAGSTAAAWGRGPGEMGKVLYVTTEGGLVKAVNGQVREASVVRIEL